MGLSRQDGEEGEFVDGARDDLAGDLGRTEGTGEDSHVAAWFTAGADSAAYANIGAHVLEDFEEAAAGVVEADVLDEDLARRHEGGGGKKIGGGGEVARDGDRGGAKILRTVDRDGEALDIQSGAEGRKEALRVIAAEGGLMDDRRAVGLEAGEEKGRLYLGAGDGKRVADRSKIPSPNS